MALNAHTRRLDCERIASEAADLLRNRFGDPGEVRDKPNAVGRFDLVTEVDHLSERLVLGRIAELSPDCVVYAEEGGLTDADGIRIQDLDRASSAETWIVDPLDGTINFAHGIPHFAVSIACWSNGIPVAGAIADPMVREMFSFEWGPTDADRLAYHDGRLIQLAQPERASQTLVYLGSSAARTPSVVAGFRGTRQLASAALALAWTGAGRCGAYVQLGGLQPWDVAVGAPFVLAAGGSVSAADGTPWPLPATGPTGVLASAASIHDEVKHLVAQALAAPASE